MGKSPSRSGNRQSATNIKEKEKETGDGTRFSAVTWQREAQSGFLKDKTDVTDAMLTTQEG